MNKNKTILSKRISASALKSLEKCTFQFYLSRYLKIPEKTWARTHAGSAAHSILECLAREKHRHHHDLIKSNQTIYASKAIGRLVRAWQYKTGMPDEIVADLDEMILLALTKTNFLDEGAIRKFPPETEFRIDLRNGGFVVGFIDHMTEYSDKFVITDFKTQRNRFLKKEVLENFQSLVYQLFVYKTYGKLAEVQYIMLRHPPTPRSPDKHIQITPPATPEQLKGFELYLEYMAELFNNFTEKEAQLQYHEDENFCERVCSYRNPVTYLCVRNKDGSGEERRYWIDPKTGELPYQVKENEVSEIKKHPGCAKFNLL